MIPRTIAVVLIALLFIVSSAAAQTCPTADRFVFPVDRSAYTRAQDYGVRSVRHDGRYHTGEDWFLADGRTLGQPVRAIANGRVTYTNPNGWGRDSGVIILEHILSDDSRVYSMYGHLSPSEAVPFPEGIACVAAGDQLGVIGHARPVPHLHWEIRTQNGRTPGAGYTFTYPDGEGHLAPSAFVMAQQARAQREITFVTTIRDTFPADPLVLNDNSLLVIHDDGAALSRILPDGRRLWRKSLTVPAHAVYGYQGNAYLHRENGAVLRVDPREGNIEPAWDVPMQSTGAPFALDDHLVFPALNGGLIALGADRQRVAWESAGINADDLIAVQTTPQMIALLNADHRLQIISRTSASPLDEAHLLAAPAMTTAADGTLWVYGRGGLWRVLSDGVWELPPFDTSPADGSAGIAAGERGEFVLYDGAVIRNITRNGVEQWRFPLESMSGRIEMGYVERDLLLVSTSGTILTLNGLGNTCQVSVPSTQANVRLWHDLGADGVLRVRIGDTLIGIDWQRFTRECRS